MKMIVVKGDTKQEEKEINKINGQTMECAC